MGFYFKISPIEWCALLIPIGMVHSSEAQNSAIEHFVDLKCPEINPIARDAKDKAAWGVLAPAIVAAVVGVKIFFPKIMALYALCNV